MADYLWGPGEDEASFAAAPARVDRPIPAAELHDQFERAAGAGRQLEALLALARHAGRTGDVALLTAFLAEHAPALDDDAAFDAARTFVLMSNHSLFAHYPFRARAALPPAGMTALLRGGEPTRVLRQLAILCDQYGLPSVAADLIDAVVALRPGWTPPLFNRALIRMSLGDFFAARGDVKVMREHGEDGWEMLQQYLQHLGGEWTFFPALDAVDGHPGADPMLRDVLPRPDAAEIAARWDEGAAHLAALGHRLAELAVARDVAPSFLPPELDPGDAPVGDANPESGIPDLLLDARRTWAVLSALSWVCGAAEVTRPRAPALASRAESLHGWAEAAAAAARSLAEGGDASAAVTWGRQPIARFDPQFTGITLVALFEAIAENAAWLVGAEPTIVEDDDDEDDDDEDEDELDEDDLEEDDLEHGDDDDDGGAS